MDSVNKFEETIRQIAKDEASKYSDTVLGKIVQKNPNGTYDVFIYPDLTIPIKNIKNSSIYSFGIGDNCYIKKYNNQLQNSVIIDKIGESEYNFLSTSPQNLTTEQKNTIKQNIDLKFDATPTLNSINPVTSNGIYDWTSSNFGNNNFIINSNFLINQRQQTSYTNPSVYTVDHWCKGGDTTSTVTPISSPNTGVRVSNSSATTPVYFIQRMEGAYFPSLAGKKVCISCNYKVTTAGTESFNFYNYYHTNSTSYGQVFLNRDGENHTSFFKFAFPSGLSTSTWMEICTFRIPPQGVIEIYWVKGEIGEVPTEYCVPDISIEMVRCMRYYRRWKGETLGIANTFLVGGNVRFILSGTMETRMYRAPTVSYYCPNASNCIEARYKNTNYTFYTSGSLDSVYSYNGNISYQIWFVPTYQIDTNYAGSSADMFLKGNAWLALDSEI